MHLLLIDRWRNVRIAPTKTPDKFYFGALRQLLHGHEGAMKDGQLEFECDEAFFTALTRQADADARKGPSANVITVMNDGLARPSFEGVPIIVLGAEPAPVDHLAAIRGHVDALEGAREPTALELGAAAHRAGEPPLVDIHRARPVRTATRADG